MRLHDADRERLRAAIEDMTTSSCSAVDVTFRERFPCDEAWELAALQDDVNMACAGRDAWGYIVPLVNVHEKQTFAIILSRRPR